MLHPKKCDLRIWNTQPPQWSCDETGVSAVIKDSNSDKLWRWRAARSAPPPVTQTLIFLTEFGLMPLLSELSHWLFCKLDRDGRKWAIRSPKRHRDSSLKNKRNCCLDHKTHHKSPPTKQKHYRFLKTLAENQQIAADLQKWIQKRGFGTKPVSFGGRFSAQTLGSRPTRLSVFVPNLYTDIYILVRARTCHLDGRAILLIWEKNEYEHILMHITPSISDTNMDVTWQDELGNALHFSGADPAAQSPGCSDSSSEKLDWWSRCR